MKVLYIANALPHYYNLVLSRLNLLPDITLTVIAPQNRLGMNCDGVYQTQEGINFKLILLNEINRYGLYKNFELLSEVLKSECPDIVVVSEEHLRAFLFSYKLRKTLKKLNAALILKSIPFRGVNFKAAMSNMGVSYKEGDSFLALFADLIKVIYRRKFKKLISLLLNRYAFYLPDAHVNYVAAEEFWLSYGVELKKVFVTRNSPDTDNLLHYKQKHNKHQSLFKKSQQIIHVGRLVPWKRVDLLINAFGRVSKIFPEANLVIVGDGPELESLKSLVSALGLVDKVEFLGAIYDMENLSKLYMESSLYVLAGMGGLSINEAMCFGLPVICSVCDGTEKFLVRDGLNGYFFKDGDVEDLVNKLILFFEKPEIAVSMSRNSEKIILEEVNINTVVNQYIKAFEYAKKNNSSKIN